jgi:hypothetical protein
MAGVMPFSITVDRTGHDYLRQMCSLSRYLVIDDITSLPSRRPAASVRARIQKAWSRLTSLTSSSSMFTIALYSFHNFI